MRLAQPTGMSDLFNVGAFHRALDYHSERHNVLASNIANENTPGFKPQELLRVESDEFHATLPMMRTEQTHLPGTGLDAEHDLRVAPDESTISGLDGNNVSLEREMSKLQANDLRYETTSKLVTRQLGLLRYAANDASSG
jgi:flagellar basal-body rod protein FlgB